MKFAKQAFGLAFTFVVCSAAHAETIKITNATPIDLFGAVYYDAKTHTRVDKPFTLPNNTTVTLERPVRKSGYDRAVYFAPDRGLLTPELSAGQVQFIPRFNIGNLQGTHFYILFDQGKFRGYSSTEKNFAPLIHQVEQRTHQFTQAMFTPLQKEYGAYKHTDEHAVVRTSATLSPEEQKFLAKRHPTVKKAVTSIIGQEIADTFVPTIAFCASGGGYRAMISFLGSFEAAQKTGFIDSVTYMAGLSGGAWGVTVATMIDNPIAHLSSRLNHNLGSQVNNAILVSLLWRKFIFRQPLSIIDIYGSLLADHLLGGAYKNPMKLSLAEQAKKIVSGTRPFPIYSAIATKKPYEWVEFNPYEVHSSYLHGAIPTWAFGSKFNAGKSLRIDPEQTLGFYLGICGSAFSANFQEIYQLMRSKISSPILRAALDAGTDEQRIGAIRVLPAQIHNFTVGLHSSPRWNQEVLTLIDAGINFNIPIPPLLGRANIIIIFDNSLNIAQNKAQALKDAELYARRKKIPFPKISYENITEKTCSVFFDKQNPQAPLIIYMPLINNRGSTGTFDVQKCMDSQYCDTQNFMYSAQQVRDLSAFTAFNFTQSLAIIKQAIKEYCMVQKST